MEGRSGDKNAVVPLVILGINGQENLYITDEGGWTADYIPAFVRRYPFVFSETADGKFTLCVDESWDGCNQEGRGQRLFDDQGERTPFLEKLLSFHSDYQRNAQLTKNYCDKLKELDLLDAKEANFTLANGEKVKLRGSWRSVAKSSMRCRRKRSASWRSRVPSR